MGYTNFEEINNDIKILKLQRKIAVEELKHLKKIASDNLEPSNWISPSRVKVMGKLSALMLLKKIFKLKV